jgi:YVTN family beta-propeller protein
MTVKSVRAFRRRPVLAPVTFLVALGVVGLAPGAHAGRAYVSNEDDGTVSVLDTQQLAVVATIPVGKRPRGLALSHNGKRLYVAVSGVPKCPPPMRDEDCAKLPRDRAADGIAVLDTATLQPLPMIRGVSDPERVALSPDGRTMFVTEEDSARLAVVDAPRGMVVTGIVIGPEPEGVRVSPDGHWVLTTSEEDNSIAIIDARRHARLHTVRVGKRPRDLAFSEDGHVAYVSGEGDASVFRVAVPDGDPAAPLLHLRPEARPMGVALDGRRGRLYVSTGHAGTVAVISVNDGALVGEIAVGGRPWGIALTDNGQRLLTANGPTADVAMVDTQSLAVLGKFNVGHGPWGVAAEP